MVEGNTLDARRSLIPPNVSEEQLAKLWWQAYKLFYETDPYHDGYLYDVLSTELDLEKNAGGNSDTQWSLLTLQLLKTLEIADNAPAELMVAKEKRDSTVKIVETILESLGLESAALAWSCIVCFLKVLPFKLSKFSVQC